MIFNLVRLKGSSNVLLLLTVCLLFLLNFYSETLLYRPNSVHQWRQVDCLSITKNYYEEGMDFFSPKIHSLRAPGGKAVSEFPILNYTVAFLWKIFGEHEFIYRLLDYIIYLTSIFILFNVLKKFFGFRAHIFFMVGLLLTSPLLTYYSFNFLSDVPALSFSIMSFSLLFLFYKTGRIYLFYLSLVFATIAVLLKASALIAFVCVVFLFLVNLFNLNKLFRSEPLFKNKLLPLLCIFVSSVLVYQWYVFALRYNTFNNGVFLLTVLPIWEMNEDAIFYNCRMLFNHLFPAFLNRPMLALFFFMVLFVCFKFKKLDVFLRCCFIFSGLFFIIYILVFFQVFSVHDYYLVNLFIFPVISIFCVADIVKNTGFELTLFMRSALMIIFIFNALYSAAFYRLRVINDDKLCVWYPFISREEKEAFEYQMWNYGTNIRPLETLRPVLRQLGINRKDILLSVTDESPEISLYFMDQKGYTLSQEQFMSDSLSIKKMLGTGAKYLVLTRPELREEKPFLCVEQSFESIYKEKRIEIFRLK